MNNLGPMMFWSFLTHAHRVCNVTDILRWLVYDITSCVDLTQSLFWISQLLSIAVFCDTLNCSPCVCLCVGMQVLDSFLRFLFGRPGLLSIYLTYVWLNKPHHKPVRFDSRKPRLLAQRNPLAASHDIITASPTGPNKITIFTTQPSQQWFINQICDSSRVPRN